MYITTLIKGNKKHLILKKNINIQNKKNKDTIHFGLTNIRKGPNHMCWKVV